MKLHPKNLIAVFLLAFLAFVLSCQQEEFVPLNISSVSPSEVLIGDTVTLSGAGFSPDYATNRVTFSGAKKPLAPIRGSTTEKLVLVVPDSAETGPLHVNILNEEFFSSPSLTVLVPLFESITPANGFAGDTVIIRGKNFRSDKNHNHVFFKAKITHTVEVISSTSTELHVIVPEAAIPGNISVLGYTGPSFSLKAGKITGIYPRQGIVGDTITVTGVGFPPSIASIPPYAVQFNSVSPPLEVKEFPNDFIPTTREVRVIVPVGTSNGKVKMIYGVAGAQVTLVSDSAFQIYPSITGYSSPGLPPGALLTIQGNSFKPKPGNANVVNVTLNGVVLKKQGTFDNENITVLIPVGATSGSVVVNANGRIATGPMFEVLAATAPVINKLTPNTQFVDQPIIIEGVNFSAVPADNIVTFSPNIELTGAQILMASATQLKVNVPEGAVTGTIKVKVKGVEAVGSPTFTLKGGGPGGTDFTITAINPTSREQKQTINITGTNFTNAGGEIGVYITETFGNGSSFLLKDLNIVSATEMTATVDTYFNPVNQQPIIYTSGQYKVSVRYLSTPTEDKSNNDKILTVEGLTPVLSSFTPTIVKAGDELTITGKYFEGVLANNQVIFIKDGIETVAVAKAVGNGTPVDGFTTMVVVVPTLVAGNYQVKVKSTTSGKISNQMPLTVEADVVTTFTPKPVYFLGITGTGTSQSVHLNKISPSAAGPTITTIYSVPADADRGITAMTFDLKPALDDSRVYFSQNSSEIDDNDGIFSRKLTGSAAKKRIIKTQILNEVGYGSGVADLTLDVANNRLFWPYNESPYKVYKGNTNDASIQPPVLLRNLPAKYDQSPGGTVYGNNKLYVFPAGANYISNVLEINPESGVTNKTLIDDADGLQIFDLKIDGPTGYFIASLDEGSTFGIYSLNLVSGDHELLIPCEGANEVFGLSLDLDQRYIYWLQKKGGVYSIAVASMDGSDIPGTAVKQVPVYDLPAVVPSLGPLIPVSIAVDEKVGGGAAQRGASINMQLKYRKPQRK